MARQRSKKRNPAKAPTRTGQRRQPQPPRPQPLPRHPEHGNQCFLSTACCDYADLLANPFEAQAVGIPREPGLPSQKYKTFARGTFSGSATAGSEAAIAFRPMAANDVYAIVTTTSAYESLDVPSNGDANSTSVTVSGPYTQAQIDTNGDVRVRIVACGVRIRYIGTNLNRGGTVTLLEHPQHAQLSGVLFADLKKYEKAEITVPDSQWITLTWQPIEAADYAYKATSTGALTGATLPLAITCSNPTSTAGANIYEYEYFCAVEAVGIDVVGKTVTTVDIDGQTQVVQALSSVKSNYAARDMLRKRQSPFRWVLSRLSGDVGRTIKAVASSSTVRNLAPAPIRAGMSLLSDLGVL